MTNRECGNCNLCCITAAVDELNKPSGTPCEHLVYCGGCSIYKDRPSACKTFQCSWLAEDVPLKHLRPDQCGVVLETFKLGQSNRGPVLDFLSGSVHNPQLARRSLSRFKSLVRPSRIVVLDGKGMHCEFGGDEELSYYKAWMKQTKRDGRFQYSSPTEKQIFGV